jgi:hypothetical protein
MTDPVDEFLAGYPADVQAIGQILRALVKRARPDAIEVLYTRQNHFDYSLSGKMREGIVYICPLQDYVRLGFYYGGDLVDPTHLLVGEGKRLRHVKVRTLADAREPALEQLVRAAWASAPEQLAKQATARQTARNKG